MSIYTLKDLAFEKFAVNFFSEEPQRYCSVHPEIKFKGDEDYSEFLYKLFYYGYNYHYPRHIILEKEKVNNIKEYMRSLGSDVTLKLGKITLRPFYSI